MTASHIARIVVSKGLKELRAMRADRMAAQPREPDPDVEAFFARNLPSRAADAATQALSRHATAFPTRPVRGPLPNPVCREACEGRHRHASSDAHGGQTAAKSTAGSTGFLRLLTPASGRGRHLGRSSAYFEKSNARSRR